MFKVENNTIEMHRGDTGVIGITARGYTFGPNDRALFTLRSGNGTVIKQAAYPMEDNRFQVEFTNSDTDSLDTGTTYEWDVRYIVNPKYSDTDRHIYDGDAVATPNDPMPCVLRRTVGQI